MQVLVLLLISLLLLLQGTEGGRYQGRQAKREALGRGKGDGEGREGREGEEEERI